MLDGLTDTSSFYQVVDAIEQQGMEKDVIDVRQMLGTVRVVLHLYIQCVESAEQKGPCYHRTDCFI